MKQSQRLIVPLAKAPEIQVNRLEHARSTSLLKELKKKYDRIRDEYPEAGLFKLNYLLFIKILSIVQRLIMAKMYLFSCTHVGKLVTTKGKPYIKNNGTIIIGDRVAIWSVFDRTKFFIHNKASLVIGSYSR